MKNQTLRIIFCFYFLSSYAFANTELENTEQLLLTAGTIGFESAFTPAIGVRFGLINSPKAHIELDLSYGRDFVDLVSETNNATLGYRYFLSSKFTLKLGLGYHSHKLSKKYYTNTEGVFEHGSIKTSVLSYDIGIGHQFLKSRQNRLFFGCDWINFATPLKTFVKRNLSENVAIGDRTDVEFNQKISLKLYFTKFYLGYVW